MDRNEILKSPEYWTTIIQTQLYRCADNYMSENGMNRTQLAEYLNVSKGYVSQVLNGDYDHRISKLVELAIAFGYVPKFEFVRAEEYIRSQQIKINTTVNNWRSIDYSPINKKIHTSECYWEQNDNNEKEAA